MPKEYRVAVIGRTGRGDYGHGLDVVWKDLENAAIVAVADEDPTGREQAAKRLGGPKAYADYHEMLDREQPDVVSVAPRWLDCHRDMVVAAAHHGCHVLLEKPLCRTLAEADEMIAACEEAGVKLAITHQTRYSPRVDQARKLIADGRLGKLLELRGRGKEDQRGGGEDMMVLGTHVMDLMRYLAGDPKWCFARVLEGGKPVTKAHVRRGAEGIGPLAGDEIHAVYGFDSPTVGYFSTRRSEHAAGKRFGLWVCGDKGGIVLGTGSLPKAWFLEDPSWSAGGGAQWVEITSAGLGQPEPLEDIGLHLGNLLIAKDLLRAVETNTQPRGGMHDARAALEMILATYESHRLNAPVTLPVATRTHPLELL
jgi:predicted dehydrogenase